MLLLAKTSLSNTERHRDAVTINGVTMYKRQSNVRGCSAENTASPKRTKMVDSVRRAKAPKTSARLKTRNTTQYCVLAC